MDDHAVHPAEQEAGILDGQNWQPVRRRSLVKALLGVTMGGTLGYVSHPWLAGERRHELAESMKAFWQRMREVAEKARHPDMTPPRTRPVELDAQGRDYERFLAGLGLRHIRPTEMLIPHFKVRGHVCNDLPPRESWKNIAPTLRVADELRQHLGVRLLSILSAYRSPAYNAACPGAATHSYHLRNMALDLVFDCPPGQVAEAASNLREKGFFSGGIGRYPGFTHIDTRGRAADWG
jgi:Peptidase M15